MYSHCVIFMRPSVEHVSCPRAACARVCDSERASNVQPSRTQNPRVSCSGISSVALIASLKKCFGNNWFGNWDASSSFFLLRHQSAFLPVVSCFRRRFREETREGPKAAALAHGRKCRLVSFGFWLVTVRRRPCREFNYLETSWRPGISWKFGGNLKGGDEPFPCTSDALLRKRRDACARVTKAGFGRGHGG